MRIRWNEEAGTVDIDGRVISASVLREITDPDKRLLFRFRQVDGIIQAIAYSDDQCIWIDNREPGDQVTDFGVVEKDKGERT